jgi:hypothetical protein
MKARFSILFLLSVAMMRWTAALHGAVLDTNGIEQITGLKGAWNAAEGVFKLPRRATTWP